MAIASLGHLGTETMRTLIVGRDITGISAFLTGPSADPGGPVGYAGVAAWKASRAWPGVS